MSPLWAGIYQGSWNAGQPYVVGNEVAYNGGFWQCLSPNTGQTPGSGIPQWNLIGGTPYVTRVVGPDEYNLLDSVPVELVPAPTNGAAVWPLYAWVELSDGDAPNESSGDNIVWASNADLQDSGRLFCEPIFQNGSPGAVIGFFPSNITIPSNSTLADIVEQALVWSADGAITGGTVSVRITLFYAILSASSFPNTYYPINFVNQAAKKFTVGGDASGLGASFDVVGSTGNNGPYTKVSVDHEPSESDAITAVVQVAKTFTVAGDHAAAFPAGSPAIVAGSTGNDGTYTVVSAVFGADTVITVAEVIPDATADGTIGHPDETVVVVSEAVPDSTADGWLKD